MASKTKTKTIEVEFPVLDPLEDRTYVQEVTLLSQDGRRITKEKMEYADKVQRTVTAVILEGVGLEVIGVKGERK